MTAGTDNRGQEDLLDRFLGAALGTFVGDALGEPVEGWSHQAIRSRFGLLDTMVREEGRYTDDTQMMIGILETLREKGRFDPAVCARRFQENFDPRRGYGRRIFGVVERIRQSIPWDEVGTDSFGNGGAMRIAPIGCFYYRDLNALKENAILSASITHKHAEGLAGAVAQATAVALAFECGIAGERIDPVAYLETVRDQVKDIDKRFTESLRDLESVLVSLTSRPETSPLDMVEAIAERYALSLRAIESVPAAIVAFLLTDTFKDAAVLAVNLGGDTDTIGAMAGAAAGAYYGYGEIPEPWLTPLENGSQGRDYVVDCVQDIVTSWLTMSEKS
jgi:poly(ADP-ribose) glycohydrolase ARH3